MTSPSAYIKEERYHLGRIAERIRHVPYDFSGDGRTVDLKKVMQKINNYK